MSGCFVGCGVGAVAAVVGAGGGAGAADGAAAARPRGTNLGLIEGPVFFLNIELMWHGWGQAGSLGDVEDGRFRWTRGCRGESKECFGPLAGVLRISYRLACGDHSHRLVPRRQARMDWSSTETTGVRKETRVHWMADGKKEIREVPPPLSDSPAGRKSHRAWDGSPCFALY